MSDTNQNTKDNEESRKIWSQIWHPSMEDNLKSKVSFYVSGPLIILFPLLMNNIYKSGIWVNISAFLFVFIITLRILVAIRYSVTEGSKLESYKYKLLKKLSGEKRIKFIKTSVSTTIFFTLICCFAFYILNYKLQMKSSVLAFMGIFYFGFYVMLLRIMYLRIAGND